ncbi:uncharacterized protein [Physcomitrium patens]|uniref:Epidermal patterning factor-like protein n=1 Tax=Physcomitrium patens TaxID=3218 RepID=A0A2K1IG73_PHYPA|nr:uncharacterized protein LOC112276415 isoform X1 [Physcomitrium patens]PNR28275.1 hypothetical protein PHYPA_028867 [Physcomitrium patens]|eukprot:XP_024363472.1 uncharacterized protein LOC112276415 isoform X1 [Physcomitrella patens]
MCASRWRGAAGRFGHCNLSPVMVAFSMMSLAVLIVFPATVVARIGPGVTDPSVPTIFHIKQMPALSSLDAENKSRGVQRQDMRDVPQQADTIFGHPQGKRISDGSSSSSSRRGLVGSSPPTCRFRCGTCTPCKPVHVAIGSPHGVISETEYYPEVWRCQCGNRYYMP